MDQNTRDYLSFRRMITPAIIQIVFWIGVGIAVIGAAISLIGSLIVMFTQDFATGIAGVVGALAWLVILPITIRIYCELIILFFQMNETLTDIRNSLAPSRPEPQRESA